MRQAMFEAALGDDVFGEDPTVNRLEEYVAALLGKEAALYAPSGTMCNQIGVFVTAARGDEVLLHEGAHVFNYEAGAPAILSGVQLRSLPGEGGVISPETVRAAVRPENVDTVSVCSSKGLGAPVGSLLAGDGETIGEARRARKVFGGGMRQAGVIAAGSLHAFEHHTDRLVEDHERAKKLANGLRDAGYSAETPETNIVLVQVGEAERFLGALAREGVLATPMTAESVRFCTHLDVGDGEIEAAVEAASRITAD